VETAVLERLQQLPAEEQAVQVECTLTCTYSCWETSPATFTCDVTGFVT